MKKIKLKKRLNKISKKLDVLKNTSLVKDKMRKKSYDDAAKEEDIGHVCEYDKKVSDKVYSFIVNVCELKKMNIELKKDWINIYISIPHPEESDASQNISGHSKKSFMRDKDDEDSVNIVVRRDKFHITRGYNMRMSYSDETLFDKLMPVLSKIVNNKSKESTLKLIDDVLIKTKLIRNNNLNELLS